MWHALMNTSLHLLVGSYMSDGPNVTSGFTSLSLESVHVDSVVIPAPRHPTFFALAPDHTRLYVAHELGAAEGGSRVSAYAVHGQTWTLLNVVASGGTGACHVSLAQDLVFVSHYQSGTLTALGLDRVTGALVASNTTVFRSPLGPSRVHARQDASHFHQLVVVEPRDLSSTRPWLYLCDLGSDAIFQLELVSRPRLAFELVHTVMTSPGAGPRHVVFHPDLLCAYATMELSNELVVYDVDGHTGHLTPLQSISSSRVLLAPTHGAPQLRQPRPQQPPRRDQKAAAVRIDPSGRYVLVSNRDGRINSIQSFAIEPVSGRVTMVDEIDSGGQHPRDFIFVSPQVIVVTNQLSDCLTFFHFDATQGTLSVAPEFPVVTISQPVAVLLRPS